MIRLASVVAGLALLTACGSDEPPEAKQPIRIAVAEEVDDAELPGKIDPPDAKWTANGGGTRALYGEPGKPPLLRMACKEGTVTVTRTVPDDRGAKALLAFVGYRGILRLAVENDGNVWKGALDAADPHWIAVTGGPFYVTVAGGGKVISPASSTAARLITDCRRTKKSPAEETSSKL